jgi:hypothetical protein
MTRGAALAQIAQKHETLAKKARVEVESETTEMQKVQWTFAVQGRGACAGSNRSKTRNPRQKGEG